MDVLFLDANVLFSAAYRDRAGLLELWELDDVERITSEHALEEARRNLPTRQQSERLSELIREVRLVSAVPDLPLSTGIRLPEKDVPILLAAIHAGATHLVTGDVTHFGRYFGRDIEGVRILSPAAYLAERGRR